MRQTFKQFIEEGAVRKVTTKDVIETRRKLGHVLKDGKEELARSLRVVPSSVSTTMPEISINLSSGTTALFVTPSDKQKQLGLGLDWFKLNMKRVDSLFRSIFTERFAEAGYKIDEVVAKERSWTYGKETRQLVISVKLSEK